MNLWQATLIGDDITSLSVSKRLQLFELAGYIHTSGLGEGDLKSKKSRI